MYIKERPNYLACVIILTPNSFAIQPQRYNRFAHIYPNLQHKMPADDQYEQQNDFAQNGPVADAVDNDYASRTGQSQVPVQNDEAPVEDPYNNPSADSDEQLGNVIAPLISAPILIHSSSR